MADAAELLSRPGKALAFALCLLLGPVWSCERQDEPAPTLGADPVPLSAERDGRGVLAAWVKQRYQGATVIHIGMRPGLGQIPDRELTALRERARAGGSETLDGAGAIPITGDNYLSAAAALGIVQKVYWVIPYPFFESAGGGARTRQFLVEQGIVRDRAAAEAFLPAGMCLQGPVRDIELTVCDPGTMHLVREPALLDLDPRFLVVYARNRDLTLLEGFKTVVDALFSRRFRVRDAALTAAPDRMPFDPAERYLASQAREAFREPALMGREAPPPLWLARDEADELLRQGKPRRAAAGLRSAIKEWGPDRGLRALLARAALAQGERSEALNIARDLCREDRDECGLILYLGDREEARGRPEQARRFFQAALDAVPGWDLAEERLAADRRKRKGRE